MMANTNIIEMERRSCLKWLAITSCQRATSKDIDATFIHQTSGSRSNFAYPFNRNGCAALIAIIIIIIVRIIHVIETSKNDIG